MKSSGKLWQEFPSPVVIEIDEVCKAQDVLSSVNFILKDESVCVSNL